MENTNKMVIIVQSFAQYMLPFLWKDGWAMSGTVTVEKNILDDLLDETGEKARRLSFSLKKKEKP